MTLLRKIQDEVTKPDGSVTSSLRMAKVLAHRLGNEELKSWVTLELNGYKDDDELPPYRKLRSQSQGDFANAFRQARNFDIPAMCIPEAFRAATTIADLYECVAAYEDLLLQETERGYFMKPWPPDLTAILGQRILEGMVCHRAWVVIPRNSIVTVVESVKNKLLDFTLAIEELNPDAGEAAVGVEPIPQEQIKQIFNTIVLGDASVSNSGRKFRQLKN